MKFKVLFIIIFTASALFINAKDDIVYPKDPNDPSNKSKSSRSSSNSSVSSVKLNIEYQRQSGTFNKGVIEGITGFYLNLIWEDNPDGSEKILIDFVKAIRIKAYTVIKKTKDNLSVVYYFPYIYDITLKDGTIIKDAQGRIKELESFIVYNSKGYVKCYTYFIRYWYEDQMKFQDNNSKDFNESPTVPKTVVIYMEFNK